MIAVSSWIGNYLQQNPQVSIDADFTSRVVDIVHEGFDLAIRIGPLADSTLAARKLGELQYGLFAAPDYLIRRGSPISPDDLASHEVLSFAGGSHRAIWKLDHGDIKHTIDLNPRLRANNVFAVRDAAIAGLGIAQLPKIVASAGIATNTLVPILSEWSLPTVPVHAVFASARYLTPKVRSFIDLAVEEMASTFNYSNL